MRGKRRRGNNAALGSACGLWADKFGAHVGTLVLSSVVISLAQLLAHQFSHQWSLVGCASCHTVPVISVYQFGAFVGTLSDQQLLIWSACWHTGAVISLVHCQHTAPVTSGHQFDAPVSTLIQSLVLFFFGVLAGTLFKSLVLLNC